MPSAGKLPLVLFEDDHLLAINKPAGINTHKPDRYAQDGIHEWLKKQQPEWRHLSILHRLDKETSGVMVFGKTPLANRLITEQFEKSAVKKRYLFLTHASIEMPRTISTPIDGKSAQTTFRMVERVGGNSLIEAHPTTGRTHQVRIHAAEVGCPVLGDREYGAGTSATTRLMLHSGALEFSHPVTGKPLQLTAPKSNAFAAENATIEFAARACATEFRDLLFSTAETNTYRLVSSKADGFPDCVVDRFGDVLLAQRLTEQKPPQDAFLDHPDISAVFLQDMVPGAKTKPQLLRGNPSSPIVARENGLRFLIRMDQGFSPVLFPDQRENRRRLREMSDGKEVLNCFAYTCSFSVAAAAGGGITTSVDLNKAYLDWGRENFHANALKLDEHDFIYGDVLDWLKRFAKRNRQWDIVLLDPPTFGTTKKGRIFRAARDYQELVRLSVRLVRKEGILFCSTNQRSVTPDQFLATLQSACRAEKRAVLQTEFETQPLDFRLAEGEKPYLKTFWLTLG